MTFLHPVSWPEVLAARAAHPEAVAVAGGTDVLVEINFHRLRPAAVLDLGRVRELGDRSRSDGVIRLGAGVTYHDVIGGLRPDLPGLAMAARTVGSCRRSATAAPLAATWARRPRPGMPIRHCLPAGRTWRSSRSAGRGGSRVC